jgi:ABC-type transport system substrate-binding protein
MRRDYTVALSPTGVGSDPDQGLYNVYGCGGDLNYNGYCNAEVDKLIDRQSIEADQENARRWSGRSNAGSPKTAPGRLSFTTAALPAGSPR